jgi:hypothetical protein
MTGRQWLAGALLLAAALVILAVGLISTGGSAASQDTLAQARVHPGGVGNPGGRRAGRPRPTAGGSEAATVGPTKRCCCSASPWCPCYFFELISRLLM